jgi:hypothetical protein
MSIINFMTTFLAVIGFAISTMGDDMLMLLPTPQNITFHPGSYLHLSTLLVCCPRKFAVPRLESAVWQWMRSKRLNGRIERDQDCHTVQYHETELASKKMAIVIFTLNATASLNSSGYFLDVNADGINITSRDEEGLFYALMTLRQIVAQSARLVLHEIFYQCTDQNFMQAKIRDEVKNMFWVQDSRHGADPPCYGVRLAIPAKQVRHLEYEE